MRVGWSNLFSYLSRKPGKYSSIGIGYDVNGLHLCAFKEVDNKQICILNQTFSGEDWASELKFFVDAEGLENSHTVISFSPKKYQLVQADKPSVPEEELSQALSWSIKELLTTQDEVTVDYFDIPAQTMGANKVNVVAIPKAELHEVCEKIMQSGLHLKTVTVDELAHCDLFPAESDAYISVIQEPGAEVCLNIVKDGHLYFSRRIRGYEQLSTFSEMELQMGIAETLSVELQRSMDFFEGQLKQAPVKKILLKMDTEHQGALVQLIKDSMLVDLQPLQVDVEKDDAISIDNLSLGALGAALSLLREEETSEPKLEATA
ncbi:MAG: MSHA biogenesis protein MshI [Alteromonadaceae bacterium]|nr:MSHA biogenesis protein MshI [Alteromonadaceae bacterium]